MFENQFTERFRILKLPILISLWISSSRRLKRDRPRPCFAPAGFGSPAKFFDCFLGWGSSSQIALSPTTLTFLNAVTEESPSPPPESEDAADMAVGLLIDVLRKISAADRYVRRGNWAACGDFPLASKLGSKRVGIVGLGRIGSKVAKRLEVFGCKISYNSRKKKDSVSYAFYTNVHELAANNDALIVCCGLNDQTRHMIDRKVLLALGKEGVIVNVGRGKIVNEKEMVQYLLQGEIGGAGLDVFDDETNVPKELFGLDNVVLSPHNSVLTPESLESLCDVIIGNFEAFFSKKPLLSELVGDD